MTNDERDDMPAEQPPSASPQVSIEPVAALCAGAAPVPLRATPAGGAFSGPGVAEGMFDPAAAGAGTHEVTYVVASPEGTPLRASTTVVVHPQPSVSLRAPGPLAADEKPVVLEGSPPGGAFSGAGVAAGLFDPAVAGPGAHLLTYTFTDDHGCRGASSAVVTVTAPGPSRVRPEAREREPRVSATVDDVAPLAHRKFFVAFLAFIALYVLANWIVWTKWTHEILTEDFGWCGDLTRLGYVAGSKRQSDRDSIDDLPRRHIENADWKGEPVDVLTIGVSNSNGMGGGRNRFYQDYLATQQGLSILNIQRYRSEGASPDQDKSPLDTLWIALHAGYIDMVKPRFVLLETGQRVTPVWYGHPIDPSAREDPSRVLAFFAKQRYENRIEPLRFMNEGNLKFALNSILYRFSPHAFFSQTVMLPLHRDMFTVPASRRLLFFHEDIDLLPLQTPEAARAINDNVNALADELGRRGIKLYFLLAVDKYDLYHELIVANPFPKPRLFELMKDVGPKRYTYIDQRELLLPLVRRGEQDVFFADDTHWSWKASEAFTPAIRFQ